jgi:uncharacterized OB-fold protein
MTRTLAQSPPSVEIGTSQWTDPFWSAARQRRLVAPKCAGCGKFRMPPTPFCPRCRSQQIEWIALSGRGTVYSYTVVVKAPLPEMEARTPYAPAVIELADADGVRLISNIVNAYVDEIRVGLDVDVVWDTQPGGLVVPRFELSKDREGTT